MFMTVIEMWNGLNFSVDRFRPVLVTPVEGRNDYISAVMVAVRLLVIVFVILLIMA